LASHRVWQIKHFYLAWFAFHFLLLIAVSCNETLWLIARGLTILPSGHRDYLQKDEDGGGAMLGLHSAKSNPLRETLATYLDFAGIDAGYGYFAPNVAPSYKLVFELHHSDGRMETQIATAKNSTVGLRLASLLDEIGRTQSDDFRQYLIKKLAAVIWREHPSVVTMRASLSQVVQPTPTDFARGKKETCALLYAYDFSLASNSTAEPKN
jgi:hypothetical protein